MNNYELGQKIARAIFECNADAGVPPTTRLQFMSGKYPDHESEQGGLCEIALAGVIARSLDNLFISNTDIESRVYL